MRKRWLAGALLCALALASFAAKSEDEGIKVVDAALAQGDQGE
jgi:hypothetical protein